MLASMLFVGLCLVVLADAMSERMTRIETMEIQWAIDEYNATVDKSE